MIISISKVFQKIGISNGSMYWLDFAVWVRNY